MPAIIEAAHDSPFTGATFVFQAAEIPTSTIPVGLGGAGRCIAVLGEVANSDGILFEGLPNSGWVRRRLLSTWPWQWNIYHTIYGILCIPEGWMFFFSQ